MNTGTPREAEIAQIERELRELRSRHANLVASVRYYLPFAIIMGVLVGCFLVYSILVLRDAAAVVTSVAILVALLGIVVFSRLAPRHKKLYFPLTSPWGMDNQASNVEILEQEITKREKRLAELNG